MKVIFMAHPVAGEVKLNLDRAKRWVKWIEDRYNAAVASSWIVECQIYDDSDPNQRAISFGRNFAMLERCDALWLVGSYISSGMLEELQEAEKLGMEVIDFTFMQRFEPPRGEISDDLEEQIQASLGKKTRDRSEILKTCV